ncbi:MAG: hypothetical protein HN793_10625, partial [Rhodospirillaceae bacterium]|nr:hypothetical protein [Rhodospirillaceae bacterium]
WIVFPHEFLVFMCLTATNRTKPDSQISLRCGDQAMFTGRMGRQGNSLAIRVDHKERKKEQ